MNFQQLRILREARRQNFNLTEVANALATSQSGVSKHIMDFEHELGVDLFVRRGKRLIGFTEPGIEILAYAEQILVGVDNIRRVASHLACADEGELIIATTHTHARYALPRVLLRFKQDFPRVQLVLHQTTPAEIAIMLREGRADIGIATEAVATSPELVAFPFYSWRHAVIAQKAHRLADGRPITLADLASEPIVTYHEGFTGRPAIDRAFSKAGLTPHVVMSAVDANIIKTYVELGLGVGVIASMAFDPERDSGLVCLSGGGLFEEITSHIALWRGRFLRGYVYRFIEMCREDLTENYVRKAMAAGVDEDYSI